MKLLRIFLAGLTLICFGCGSPQRPAPVNKTPSRAPASEQSKSAHAPAPMPEVAPKSAPIPTLSAADGPTTPVGTYESGGGGQSGDSEHRFHSARRSKKSGDTSAAGDGQGPSLATHVRNWYDQLKQGKIEYHVPDVMKWKEGSTVSVVLHGYQSVGGAAPADQTGSGELKVSDRMKVVLTDPENPDEFSIAKQQGTEDIQFVPENGTATWNWSVTPNYTAKGPQKLVISAWVIYPDGGDRVSQQLPVYQAAVNVRVPEFSDIVRRMVEGDPEYWVKYGLPGGSGFLFVAGFVTWLLQRRSKREKSGADPKDRGQV